MLDGGPNIIVPLAVMSIICGVIGLVAPFLVPKGPNRGIIQTMLTTTAVCFYIFWLCCLLAQMNPLFGPELNKEVMYIVQRQWGNHAPAGSGH